MGAWQPQLHLLHTSRHSQQHTKAQGITEVVLPASSEHQYAYVLPMLAHLSRQCEDRWFTWIAPRGITRKLLMDYGFALDKLRIVYTRNDEDTLRILGDALAMGNSDTVVVSYESLNDGDVSKLEAAARKGQTQGLLLRHRRENW